jgi:hypothetical protein
MFVVLYTILVQLWPYIYRSRYFNYFRTKISHQRLINDDIEATASAVVVQNQIQKEVDEDISHATANTSELPLPSSTHVSANKPRNTRVLPKRLRGLDTFRGFSLMVMIFVNYGGMYSIMCEKTIY